MMRARLLEAGLRWGAALAILFASGCFRADIPENIQCADYDPPCPGSLDCIDGYCRSPGDGLGDDASAPDDDGGVNGGRVITSLSRQLDLLFVIDDSLNMAAHQEVLVAAFPRLLEVLGAGGQLPDLHLGIVSTDVGADPRSLGEEFVVAGCEGDGRDGRLVLGAPGASCGSIDGSWLVDVADAAGGRSRNYQGSLIDRFACAATLGSDGCGFEMPLEALRRAIGHPDNEGFFRDASVLGVIILSDEDDCSIHDLTMLGDSPFASLDSTFGPLASFRCTDFGVRCESVNCTEFPRELRCEGVRRGCEPDERSAFMHPPAHFVEALVAFKGGHADLVVAAVVGDPEPFEVEHQFDETNFLVRARLVPSCQSAAGPADPAVRLHAFADAFAQGHRASVCESSLDGPLGSVAEALAAALNQTCLEGDVGIADEAGQPSCEVVEIARSGETPIPACAEREDDGACWRAETSALCDTPSGLMLVVDRGDTPAPAGGEVRASCAIR
jgi:hypothetical protein